MYVRNTYRLNCNQHEPPNLLWNRSPSSHPRRIWYKGERHETADGIIDSIINWKLDATNIRKKKGRKKVRLRNETESGDQQRWEIVKIHSLISKKVFVYRRADCMARWYDMRCDYVVSLIAEGWEACAVNGKRQEEFNVLAVQPALSSFIFSWRRWDCQGPATCPLSALLANLILNLLLKAWPTFWIPLSAPSMRYDVRRIYFSTRLHEPPIFLLLSREIIEMRSLEIRTYGVADRLFVFSHASNLHKWVDRRFKIRRLIYPKMEEKRAIMFHN